MVEGSPSSEQPPIIEEENYIRIDISKITIPKGWSNKDKGLALDFYWTGKDDTKASLASDYGLSNAKPVITQPPPSGDVLFVFQSAAKFYIWNGIDDSVCRIDGPNTLEEIFAAIDKLGVGGLKLVLLRPR